MENSDRLKILSTNIFTNKNPFLGYFYHFFFLLGNKVASAAIVSFVSRGCNIEDLSFCTRTFI